MTDPLHIAAPVMPPTEQLAPLLAEIRTSGQLTNRGALHDRLEQEVAGHLGTRATCLTSSGTMALMMALRMGDLSRGSEVITSPLSFVATAQAIAWLGLRPVFADIDPTTLNLCPRATEAAITPQTRAILPVHLYGTLCDVDAFAALARQHDLHLVYDAAHAFGVTKDEVGIGHFGHASAFSTHATKLVNTVEGGIVTSPDASDFEHLARMRNFGLMEDGSRGPGVNGKLSELHAAIGLLSLKKLDEERRARRRLRAIYDEIFTDVAWRRPVQPGVRGAVEYYPLRIGRDRVERFLASLAAMQIFARRYFPLLCGPNSAFPDADIATSGPELHAETAAEDLICIPLHGRVTEEHIQTIQSVWEKVR